ncbi:hypothetical protein BDI4_810016 [Burkholderia diffusa]|nr:hypothetical protein BDI4_810016 [Burkholderia diffusa]
MPSSGSRHAHPRSHRLRPHRRQHGLGALLHDARPRPYETHGVVACHPRRAVDLAVPVHPVRELDGLDPFDRPADRALMHSFVPAVAVTAVTFRRTTAPPSKSAA